MADKIDLTGFAESINGAFGRGRPVVIGYVDADDRPAMSFRGSARVHSDTQLAIWARKRDEGLVADIVERPAVQVLYFDPDGPGPRYLSILGRARIDEAGSEAVYALIPEVEQSRDPEKAGVAVVIDVDSVFGFGPDGQLQQSR
jgi:hypothetical protein